MADLYLYKVSRTKEIGYDEYSAFICAAESAEAARRICPQDYGKVILATDGFWYDEYSTARDEPYVISSWPDNISSLTVELLGTAKPELPAGVILASFNAG